MSNARQRPGRYIAGDGHAPIRASCTKQALYHLLVGLAVPLATARKSGFVRLPLGKD